MNQKEAQQWMNRVADGDRQAVAPLYQYLLPIAERAARQRLPSQGDWQEVAQKSLIRLFEEAPRWRRNGSIEAWCLTLVYWECRSEQKRHQRGSANLRSYTLQQEVATDGAERHPEEKALRHEQERFMNALMQSLSTEERELLGLEDRELRSALSELSPAAFRKRKQRLLDRLREQWRLIWKEETS
ncbi:MAG: sigma-70 family RNA polymerase sigma factor [Polyangiaceae bacterium]|nr:sigma-70 family RNA polymerase sigma factor [Polyangiaceae bacterium]